MSEQPAIPTIENLIAGREVPAAAGETLDKLAPATGAMLSRLVRSRAADIDAAVTAAGEAQPAWGRQTPVARGAVLRRIAHLAGGDVEAHRATQAADRQVDLGAQAAAGTANGLIFRPPFLAPAACWWARTIVESMIRYSKSGSSDIAARCATIFPCGSTG